MTRKEIVNAFMKKENAHGGGALSSTGGRLMSYGTCIAQWIDEGMIINRTKYSVTTSTHQGMIPITNVSGKVAFVENVRRGTPELV